jgi:hypothetical protein
MSVDEGTTGPEHTGAPDQGSYQSNPMKLAHDISLFVRLATVPDGRNVRLRT